jgi:DNA-binding beta-propeller fold protein YncE
VQDFTLTLALFSTLATVTAALAGSFAANLLHDVYTDRRRQDAVLAALGFRPAWSAFPGVGLGSLVRVDIVGRKVLGYLKLASRGAPQDIRISPDGRLFYVADMQKDGVFLVDGDNFTKAGFIATGVGTHGLYPSRDGRLLYVTNRGSHANFGRPHGPGSVAVIDFATQHIVRVWPIPGGGSPDMGNVTADGKHLWLTGRWDDVVYRIDKATGEVRKVPVGLEPHGLCVWPQPGRYSLGHTGNMR